MNKNLKGKVEKVKETVQIRDKLYRLIENIDLAIEIKEIVYNNQKKSMS